MRRVSRSREEIREKLRPVLFMFAGVVFLGISLMVAVNTLRDTGNLWTFLILLLIGVVFGAMGFKQWRDLNDDY